MPELDELQLKKWMKWFEVDFQKRFAYAFDDDVDIFHSIVTDVLIVKLPTVSLTNKRNSDAYIKTMLRNRAWDYIFKVHKKHPIPKELEELGQPYTKIFFEFCLGKLPSDVIATKLKLALEKVKFWVQWLKTEQRCPQRPVAVSMNEVEDTLSTSNQPEYQSQREPSSVESAYSQSQWLVLARWLLGEFSEQENPHNSTETEKIRELFKHKLEDLDSCPELPLTADDVLLLRMYFEDELSYDQVGEVFNKKGHQIKYRLNENLITLLRRYFSQLGLVYDD